jgi:hypothetical protein
VVAAALTDEPCGCDGSGWIVQLDRTAYAAPADESVMRVVRCACLEAAQRRDGGLAGRLGRDGRFLSERGSNAEPRIA